MIAERQQQKTKLDALKTLLSSGRVPSQSQLAKAVGTLLPQPGKPTAQVTRQKRNTPFDLDQYNTFWERVDADLRIGYDQLFSTISDLTTQSEQVLILRAGIATALGQIDEETTLLSLRNTAADAVRESFTTLQQINPEKTTALLNFSDGTATLPVAQQPKMLTLTDAQASISTTSSGQEITIPGLSISQLLTATPQDMWITSVLAPGGGCTYQLSMTLSAKQVTGLSYKLAYQGTIQFSIDTGNGWVETDPLFSAPLDLIGLQVTITTSEGIPTGNQFLYLFGLEYLYLIQHTYQQQAVIVSEPIELPYLTSTPFSTVTLHQEATIPSGSSITYGLTLLDNESTYNGTGDIPITPDIPLALLTTTKTCACLDDNTQVSGDYAQALTRLGIRTHNLPCPSGLTLSAEGNGVYIGENQWYVRYYNYARRDFASHTPGPSDWLAPPTGITPNEILTTYSNAERGTGDYSTRSDTVIGNSFLLEDYSSYWFTITVTCSQATSYAVNSPTTRETGYTTLLTRDDNTQDHDILEYLAAFNQAAATQKIQASVFVNGAPLKVSNTQAIFAFQQGDNVIDLYLSTAEMPDQLSPTIYLGLSFTQRNNTLFPYRGDTDFNLNLAGVYDYAIIGARARSQPLERVTLTDLQYNTPIFYTYRYAAETRGTTTYLFVKDAEARYGVYHTAQTQGDLGTRNLSAIVTATLTAPQGNTCLTPILRGYELLFS